MFEINSLKLDKIQTQQVLSDPILVISDRSNYINSKDKYVWVRSMFKKIIFESVCWVISKSIDGSYRCLMSVWSKPKIGCSSLITNKWTSLSSMFKNWCSSSFDISWKSVQLITTFKTRIMPFLRYFLQALHGWESNYFFLPHLKVKVWHYSHTCTWRNRVGKCTSRGGPDNLLVIKAWKYRAMPRASK